MQKNPAKFGDLKPQYINGPPAPYPNRLTVDASPQGNREIPGAAPKLLRKKIGRIFPLSVISINYIPDIGGMR
jgi:hypothetical protein